MDKLYDFFFVTKIVLCLRIIGKWSFGHEYVNWLLFANLNLN